MLDVLGSTSVKPTPAQVEALNARFNEVLYGKNGVGPNAPRIKDADSLWDIASRSFTRDANGNFRLVAQGADDLSVFVQSELPELIKHESKLLNGISIAELNRLGKNELQTIKLIAIENAAREIHFGSLKNGSVAEYIAMNADNLAKAMQDPVKIKEWYELRNQLSPTALAEARAGENAVISTAKQAGFTTLSFLAAKLGTIAIGYSLYHIAKEAQAVYDTGNHEAAIKMAIDNTTSLAAGIAIGGAVTSFGMGVLSGLALANPVGIAVGLVAVAGLGIYAGIKGEDMVKSFLSGGSDATPQVFEKDGWKYVKYPGGALYAESLDGSTRNGIDHVWSAPNTDGSTLNIELNSNSGQQTRTIYTGSGDNAQVQSKSIYTPQADGGMKSDVTTFEHDLGRVTQVVQHTAQDGTPTNTVKSVTQKDGRQVITTDDHNNNTTLLRMDANGNHLVEEWKKADGSFGQNLYDPETGRRTSDVTQSDGSRQVLNDDGMGNKDLRQYNTQGSLTETRWEKFDGSRGVDKINPEDGSKSGISYDAAGNSTRYVDDNKGNKESAVFDPNNQMQSRSWEKADGSYGNDKVVDGVKTSEYFGKDGHHQISVFNPQGRLESATWDKKDGSHGSDTFNPDGSSSGIAFKPDGYYTKYIKGADGSLDATSYTSWNTKISRDWSWPDGSKAREVYDGSAVSGIFVRPDKSSQVYQDDGKGNTIIREIDKNNQITDIKWQRADGSRGQESIAPDKSVTGVAYKPDGQYVRYTNDNNGSTTTVNYDKDGNFISSQWTKPGAFGGKMTDEHGNLIIYANYGKDGSTQEVYQPNGVTRINVVNRDTTVKQTFDDGQGTRIITVFGPDGKGIVSNTNIKYNPDGSGTVTTTTENGTTEQSFGPGTFSPLSKPDSPKDSTPDLPQIDIPSMWDPSISSKDPFDNKPMDDDVTGPEEDRNGEIVNDDEGETRKDDIIEDIEDDFDDAETLPSPIALDLNGDGLKTVDINNGAFFDHGGDGFAEASGWIQADDGLLVRDLNENGKIDSGRELFGSETLLANGQKAANGFDALAEFDLNRDGLIDANDSIFNSLKVWKDKDGDGVTDAGELFDLPSVGVKAINVAYINDKQIDIHGNEHRQIGSYIDLSGVMHTAADVWFRSNPTFSVQQNKAPLSPEIAALPDVKGFGKVYDLQQAMQRDTSGKLKQLVQQFMQEESVQARNALVQDIIYHWTGVQNVDPASRAASQIYGNVIGDARKLEALEEFMGNEWYGVWCWRTRDPNPHGRAAPVLLKAFNQLSEMIYSQLVVQSTLKPLVQQIRYRKDPASGLIIGDLSVVAEKLTSQIIHNRSKGKETLGEFIRALKGMNELSKFDLAAFSKALAPLGGDISILVDAQRGIKGTEYADNLKGGLGSDLIQGLSGSDQIEGGAGNDTIDGGADHDMIHGGAGEDMLMGGRGDDHLYGGAGKDSFYFARGDGKDTIHEDYRDDTLIIIDDLSLDELKFSRSGANLLVDFTSSDKDQIILADFFADGVPQAGLILQRPNGVRQKVNLDDLLIATLLPTEHADVLHGSSLGDKVFALDGDDLVYGRGGDDTIDGQAGKDNLRGGDGNDQLAGGLDHDKLYGDSGADKLAGDAGNDTLYGGEGDDNLSGGDGNDVLDPGFGSDTMAGGAGDDSYRINDSSQVIMEDAAGGIDSVESSISLALAPNIEHLSLSGDAALHASGNAGDNTIHGNAGANQLSGEAGNDSIHAGGGNDTLEGGSGVDILHGDEGSDLIQGGADADRLFGEQGDDSLHGGDGDDLLQADEGNDLLIGGAGDDFLDGGEGNDTMQAGAGDDTYLIDEAGDQAQEAAGEGLDTINSRISFTLGANLENLLLVGDANLQGVGNDQNNGMIGNHGANLLQGMAGDDSMAGGAGGDTLEGGSGNDSLDGGTGRDQLRGGAGDDVYHVDDMQDVLQENADNGYDHVFASVSYTLSEHLEALTLNPDAGYASANGNSLDNLLRGNEVANVLDGGAGADTMEGGGGNDSYVVDNAADQVIDSEGDDDKVQAWINYQLGEQIENLELLGDADLDGSGNAMDNRMQGNAGNNLLDGGAGADQMQGGAGNDTYITDSEGDRISESSDEGIDTIVRSFDTLLVLNDNVENLTLAGDVQHGNGNELDNLITGNDADNSLLGLGGNDTLIGGLGKDSMFGREGADSMVGGAGDDYYEIDDAGDVIVELANEGYEMVRSTVSWTLGDNLERLALDGEEHLNANGNALNNGLWGNAGNNMLAGGLGNDYMEGGLGDDVYLFNKGDGKETIDNTDLSSAVDILRFGAGISENDVSARRQDNNLFILLKGGTDQVAFLNYFGATEDIDGQAADQKIDRIEFANGAVWDQSMIQTVVDRALNNHPPTVTNYPPALTARAGTAFTYVVPQNTVTDPDSWDSVSYSAKMSDGSALPAWLQFDAASRTFSGTPGTADVGVLQFVLWGTDNYGYSAGAGVRLTVGAPNNAPVLSTPLADQTANVGALFSFAAPSKTFTDPDAGDSLSYSATQADGSPLPAWLNFNPATRTFSGTPSAIGNVSVKLTAKDTGNLSVSDVFEIAVKLQNLNLQGTSGSDTLQGGAGNDTISGLAGNDSLLGFAGNDVLDGGAGNDSLLGGAGDDLYIVDSSQDAIGENANEGVDTVQASASFALSANLENLSLSGSNAINGAGNALNNQISGNSAANFIDGGAGNDSMAGGLGNDVYVVDSAQDQITENAGEGTDQVQSSISLTLGANLENLFLTGSNPINGAGNALNNQLSGNSAANLLDGGLGNDTMAGGAGNDTYVVDSSLDGIIENASEGTDLVQASVSYTLPANLENLSLSGSNAINGTGNSLHNQISGNSAANLLDGGAGNDSMAGGAGNDSYVVDNALDVITENLDEGTDLVQAGITYTLGANLENLTLSGSSAINGTGNAQNNLLIGNSAINSLNGAAGNDTLDGGAGADKLAGGAGNDVYLLDNTGDVVTENSAEGIDQVRTALTHTLAANVEALWLSGSNAVNGTGNTLNNLLWGNGAVNSLNGAAGHDILQGFAGNDILSDNAGNNLFDGGAGNDSITGGSGNELLLGGSGNDTINTGSGADVILFNLGDGQDTIAASSGKDNTVSLGKGIKYADLLFKKSSNDLILVTGATEQITFKDWYASSTNRSVANLQVVIEGTSDYNSSSTNKLNNKKVQQFNFDGLVAAFDQARSANPSLSSWALSTALLAQHVAGNDGAALGGDLAYQYAGSGNLAALSMTPAHTLLSNSQFGLSAQALQASANLQDSSPRLG
ncbi:putative Ig domain-containing protein [Massilia sp. W12]|uniref:putative Ig domain-containing protein n=1 Tax=Massilia sp. W12 TaxID=3126507 RepID=UPI0030D0A66B